MDTKDHSIPPDFSTHPSYNYMVQTLTEALPRPIEDTPEAVARRDRAAIAAVHALNPANAAQFGIATQYVVVLAMVDDFLRRSRDPQTSAAHARQWATQAARMEREAKNTLRSLRQLQAHQKNQDPAEVARIERQFAAVLSPPQQQTPPAPSPAPVAPAKQPEPGDPSYRMGRIRVAMPPHPHALTEEEWEALAQQTPPPTLH